MPDYVVIEDETLRQGFTQIPNTILRRPDISPGAKLTYMVWYCQVAGPCPRPVEGMGYFRHDIIHHYRTIQGLPFPSRNH